ncbi:MAG: flavin reductase family protein [Alphaproteobacteria bacterium]|nr:flavin reductase family protein [Alphaproteobacteria bacterium]
MRRDLPSIPAEAFRVGMRRLAAGVTIVTAMHDGARNGLTATAVTSLSADPPQVLVCVNRTATAHDLIHRGAALCVNILAQEHRDLAARFAGMDGVHGPERFDIGTWTTLVTGSPVLSDAIAAFDCVVDEAVDSATHTIFIGRVVGISAREDGRPLVYEAGRFGTFSATPERRPRTGGVRASSTRRRGSRR